MWSVPAAIKWIRGLEHLDLQYVEQPVPDFDVQGLAQVRRSVGVPIAADEGCTDIRSALELIKSGINVNAIAPGVVDTRVHTGEPGEVHKETLESAGAAGPPTLASAACTSGRHGASAGAFASIVRQIVAASRIVMFPIEGRTSISLVRVVPAPDIDPSFSI